MIEQRWDLVVMQDPIFMISMWNYYKYHDIIDVFDESEFFFIDVSNKQYF